MLTDIFLSLVVGNKRFRDLIDQDAPHYVTATTKLGKTQVIAAVIDKVRSDSPGGGFVKKDFYTGRWYEIGNEKARDKVGHAIRKAAEELQKEKGGHKSSKKKSQKVLASKGFPLQKGKKGGASSSQPSASSLLESSLANQMSNINNIYSVELVAPSFARRPFTMSRYLMNDGQIMSTSSGPSVLSEAPQTFMSNLRGICGAESSNRFQPTMSLASASGNDSCRGVHGTHQKSCPLDSPSGSSLANRLATLREMEMLTRTNQGS